LAFRLLRAEYHHRIEEFIDPSIRRRHPGDASEGIVATSRISAAVETPGRTGGESEVELLIGGYL